MTRKTLIVISTLILALLLAGTGMATGDKGTMSPPSQQAQEGKPNAPLVPVGTAFTYQGQLTDGGSPANGPFDFQFRLYDAAAGGTQVGSTLQVGDLAVANGLFSTNLNFGQGAFGGGARWLDIGVRPGASGGAYTVLTPRQELTPAPSSLSLPNVYADESNNFVGVGRDTRVSGNEVFGIRHVGSANDYGGMYVETSHVNGWPFYGYATNGSFRAWTYYNGTDGSWYLYNAGNRMEVPNEGGLFIGPSATYSLVISNTTGSDGLRIYDTADDAIQIGSDPNYSNYGLYIPSPGVGTYGLWPNTAQAAGEWALFTVDNIQAGNVSMSGLSLEARVEGSDALTPGDIVAVTGLGEPIPGGTTSLPVVRLADSEHFTGVIGVVQKRMVFEVAPGKEKEGERSMHSAAGPAQAGDYVSLAVLGVTQVKIDPSTPISKGDRLTASSTPGHARPLQTRTLDGMTVTEGAQSIGIALAAPTEGQATIPVYVTLR